MSFCTKKMSHIVSKATAVARWSRVFFVSHGLDRKWQLHSDTGLGRLIDIMDVIDSRNTLICSE